MSVWYLHLLFWKSCWLHMLSAEVTFRLSYFCWHAAAPVPTRMCFTVLAFCSVWFSVRGSLKAPKVDYPLIKVKPVTQPLAVHGM